MTLPILTMVVVSHGDQVLPTDRSRYRQLDPLVYVKYRFPTNPFGARSFLGHFTSPNGVGMRFVPMSLRTLTEIPTLISLMNRKGADQRSANFPSRARSPSGGIDETAGNGIFRGPEGANASPNRWHTLLLFAALTTEDG